MGKSWSTRDDIVIKLNRLWDRGDLLREAIQPEDIFPLTISLKVPTSCELSGNLVEVIKWAETLRRGKGYTLLEEEKSYRLIGRNQLPYRVCIHTLEDAVGMIGKRTSLELFKRNVHELMTRWPQLKPWIIANPKFLVDGMGEDCPKYIAILQWFLAHPCPDIYVRQLDIAGVDTKFIEGHTKLLEKLLTQVLSPEQINPEADTFEGRFFLKAKPPVVRLRILDERFYQGGFSDITVPIAEFAQWDVPFKRIFFTENLVNFLCFPQMEESIILFGSGHDVSRFQYVPWLKDQDIYYWGDIDTHGFHILGRLRGILPQIQSILMDSQTLMAHQNLWGMEEKPHAGTFVHLTQEEHDLATALQRNEFGVHIRMEQERIGFRFVEETLSRL